MSDDYDDVNETEGFDLDEELSGIQAAQEFLDPIKGTHVFYWRPILSIDKITTDEGAIHVGRVTYEIIGVDDPALISCVGGLFGETFRMGGAVKDAEKMSANDQIKLGKQQFLTRLMGYKPEGEKPSDKLEYLEDKYTPTPEGCFVVRGTITAKSDKTGEYMNIKKVRVLDPDYPILGSEEEEKEALMTPKDYEAYTFYSPRRKEGSGE